MAISPVSNQFLDTVFSEFMKDRQYTETSSPLNWVTNILWDPQSTQEHVDSFANKILSDLHSSNPKNDSKRYQFGVPKPSVDLLNAIFEESFRSTPEPVIRDAERIKGSFYPLWKRVCLIYIPHALGTFFGNPLIKVVISIAAFYYSFKLANAGFKRMVHSLTARAIPFFINNTPIAIIRSINRTLNSIDWVRQHKFRLLVGAFVLQKIILRLPRIPYFTDAIRNINILNIGLALYRSPQRVGSFLFDIAYSGATFVWKNSNSISVFFNSISIKTEQERIAVSKKASCAVWIQLITEKIPPNRSQKSLT